MPMKKVIHVLLLSTFIWVPLSRADDMPWTEKVKMGMDFRYRHEMQDAEENTAHPRHRQRIRARLNIEGEVDEDVSLHLRLATGSDTPSSTIASGNETLGDGGANDPFWLDKAYVQWKATDTSKIHLGKFGVPFYMPAKSQLIWDGDYTPEGLAYKYKRESESVTWFFNTAATWLDENSSPSDSADQGSVGAQLGAEISMGEPSLVVAIAHHNFPNLKDASVIDGGTSGDGNTTYTSTSTHYLYDYQLLEAALELKSEVAGMLSSLYVNYVQNSDPSSENIAYIAGFQVGKMKQKGDFTFHYNYRKVEKDAVVANLQDSDFADGKTDSQGHTLSLGYGIFNHSKVVLAYFDAERNVSTTKKSYDRVHLDFSFEF